jgi:hypothetical protein
MLYNLTMTRHRQLASVVVLASGLSFAACATSRNAVPNAAPTQSTAGLSGEEREWLALGTPESQWVWVPGQMVTQASAELPPDAVEYGLSSSTGDINNKVEQPPSRIDCRGRPDQCSDEVMLDDSIFNTQVD